MSLFEDTYRTIESPVEGEYKEKGSKFIGYAYPFESEGGLKDILAEIRSLHPKARHYCYAYRVGADGEDYRVNDDGEPSGTGGRPILNALLSARVTNILVVVVRYFGGTLLGVPGLINAYKSATQDALSAADIIEKTSDDVYIVYFQYLQMNDIMRIIKDENIEILTQHFDNSCSIEFAVRKANVNRVVQKIEDVRVDELTYIRTK